MFKNGDRLYQLLKGSHPQCDFLYLPETVSTNTKLKELCQQGELLGPTLLYTDMQTAGRGTRGRVWFQPYRELQRMGLDLAISVAAPQLGPRLLSPQLSLLVGAQVALLVERAVYAEDLEPGGVIPPIWWKAGVKWPNDIMVETKQGWRKAGGILIETVQPHAMGRRWVVIGIGLNINSLEGHFPPDLAGSVGTLREWRAWNTSEEVSDVFIEREILLCHLADALATFVKGGGLSDDELNRAWYARDCTRGTHYTLTRDGVTRQVIAQEIDTVSGGLWVGNKLGERWLVTSYTELSAPE